MVGTNDNERPVLKNLMRDFAPCCSRFRAHFFDGAGVQAMAEVAKDSCDALLDRQTSIQRKREILSDARQLISLTFDQQAKCVGILRTLFFLNFANSS